MMDPLCPCPLLLSLGLRGGRQKFSRQSGEVPSPHRGHTGTNESSRPTVGVKNYHIKGAHQRIFHRVPLTKKGKMVQSCDVTA